MTVNSVSGTSNGIWLERLKRTLVDMHLGLQQWPTWWVLAFNDIRQRYRRSVIGQFWLTLSMVATIAGIGLVFGVILKQNLGSYLPYLGIGLIVWNLLSSLVNDLAVSYIGSETYLRSYPGPRSIVIYRTIARNFLIGAHNLVIAPFLIIIFEVPITLETLLVLPGLLMIALNATWIGMLLGPFCARFRDLPQVIGSVVQLAFFLTPILYRPTQLEGRLWALTTLNPFASFLEIIRAPLLGTHPDFHQYIMVGIWTIIGFLVAIPFYARFKDRVVYWI